MKRQVPVLLLGAILLTTISGLADTKQDLIRLEQQMTDALVRSDAQAIETFWADDLVWIGINGKASSRAEQLAGMKTPAPANAPTLSAKNNEMNVRVYGDTAVVTVYSTWTSRSESAESKSEYTATHVWRKQRGKWKLVSAHISRRT
jgi:uncharacterized protein (TIGR02246 family)